MKQALLEQEMNRDQDNGHLGWPDYTVAVVEGEDGEGRREDSWA